MGQDERRGAADRDSERETRAREIWGPPSTAADQPTAALPVPPAVPLAAAPTTAGRRARGGSGRVVRELVETLLLALVIFLAVRLFVANFRVEGESMAQSLDNGQMLLVNANAYHVDLNRILNILPGEDTSDANLLWTFGPPERGDIVVFNPPEDSEKPYIKRVIGLAGDRITFDNGGVLVNGEAIAEPYIAADVQTRCAARNDEACDLVVPDDQVYLMGDNRERSQDSRAFGAVPIESIIGKAWLSYWPLGDIGPIPHYDYPNIPDQVGGPAAAAGVAGTPAVSTPRAERTPKADRASRTDRTPRPDRASRPDRAGDPTPSP